MKVFQINVKHSFTFQIINKKIISTYDDRYPILNTRSIWHADTNTYERKNSLIDRYKIVIPAVQVYKKDLEKWFRSNLESIISYAIEMDKIEFEKLKNLNIIVCTRNINNILNEEILEVGVWLPKEIICTNYQNKKLQKILNSYLNLKAFW